MALCIATTYVFLINIELQKLVIVEFECGRTTSENGTYFVNPSSPERICNLMINRLNDDICQVTATTFANGKIIVAIVRYCPLIDSPGVPNL